MYWLTLHDVNVHLINYIDLLLIYIIHISQYCSILVPWMVPMSSCHAGGYLGPRDLGTGTRTATMWPQLPQPQAEPQLAHSHRPQPVKQLAGGTNTRKPNVWSLHIGRISVPRISNSTPNPIYIYICCCFRVELYMYSHSFHMRYTQPNSLAVHFAWLLGCPLRSVNISAQGIVCTAEFSSCAFCMAAWMSSAQCQYLHRE